MAGANKQLLLIGGGHTHALFLAQLAEQPIAGLQVTCIDMHRKVPYTGMLPGYIAGHYVVDEILIDLEALAHRAGAHFQAAQVVGLDTDSQTLTCVDGTSLAYDIASFDIGIHSSLVHIPGAESHTVAAKPLHTYAAAWEAYVQQVGATPATAPITVVGGGAAGVELALAMQHRVRSVTRGSAPAVQLLEADTVLRGVSTRTKAALERALEQCDIAIYEHSRVAEFQAAAIVLTDGTSLPSSFTVTAAGARPYKWLEDTSLILEQGYIAVKETLQTLDYENIFAVGDCAHFLPRPLPKAGVYAVRQAPILYTNIRALVRGEPVTPYSPQATYLKLISLGDKRAIADKYGLPVQGRLFWLLKNYIDQSFMRKFE